MTPEEKNKICAEKIIGLCWHENYERFMGEPCSGCGDVNCTTKNPDFYHSIADAFLLVEKMRETGFGFSLTDYAPPSPDFDAEFISFDIGAESFMAKGIPSAAIVDAALKAIGG